MRRISGWVLLLVLSFPIPSRAQCGLATWGGGFDSPGVPSWHSGGAVFDDGNGPAVYLSTGALDSSRVSMLRWTGTEWIPFGLGWWGYEPVPTVVKVLDLGAGPRLVVSGSIEGVIVGPGSANVVEGQVVAWDGSQWSSVAPYLQYSSYVSHIRDLEMFDDGSGNALFAVGVFHGFGNSVGIARRSGTGWTGVGGGIGGQGLGYPTTLAVFDDGTGPALYAGGNFTMAGGLPIGALAKWNGTVWTAVGGGFTGGVSTPGIGALALHDDGSGPALYAAGYFSQAGGVPATNIARWNGTTWSALGSGISSDPAGNPAIHKLVSYDDGSGPALYASGNFTSAGGLPVRNIARWRQGAWSGVGAGLEGTAVNAAWVASLFPFTSGGNSSLIARGVIAGSQSRALNGIARWNGSDWLAFGDGLGTTGSVQGLKVATVAGTPSLFAIGNFEAIGSAVAIGIASFDGAAWQPLGSGILQAPPLSGSYSTYPGYATSLETYDDGSGTTLFAAGNFNRAGGLPVQNIAKWNGAAWSDVALNATGPVMYVRSLATYDPGNGLALYAAGSTAQYGGGPPLLRRAQGQVWSEIPIPPGAVPNPSAGMKVFDSGNGPTLVFAGEFSILAGAPSPLARFDGLAWIPVTGAPMPPGSIVTLTTGDLGSGAVLLAAWWTQNPSITRVSQWNGSVWTTVGAAFEGTIQSLSVVDAGAGAQLLAAGRFSAAGGLSPHHLARWNGAQWVAVVDGLTDLTYGGSISGASVSAVATFDTGTGPALYVGGFFSRAGSVVARSFARIETLTPTLGFSITAIQSVTVVNGHLTPGREYFNVFSLEPSPGGVGTGPYLGLSASDPSVLLAQLMAPPGTLPFHFFAAASSQSSGPYVLPPGFVIDGLCLDLTGGLLGCVSSAVRIGIQ